MLSVHKDKNFQELYVDTCHFPPKIKINFMKYLKLPIYSLLFVFIWNDLKLFFYYKYNMWSNSCFGLSLLVVPPFFTVQILYINRKSDGVIQEINNRLGFLVDL